MYGLVSTLLEPAATETNRLQLGIRHRIPSLIGHDMHSVKSLTYQNPTVIQGKAGLYYGKKAFYWNTSQGAMIISNSQNVVKGEKKTKDLGPGGSRAHRGSKQRKGPRASVANCTNPAEAPDMNSKERRSLTHALQSKADNMCSCCCIPLPRFVAPIHEEILGPLFAVKFLSAWLDWIDSCQQILAEHEQADPSRYNWSSGTSLLAAFSQLQGVYGAEYLLCKELWQSRGLPVPPF